MNSSYNFTYVSTFAGCGGSSTGYELAGGKGLLAVEFNENAMKNYKINHPNTPIYYGDISNLNEGKIKQLIPGFIKGKTVDILDGSPPCQGFSQSGKCDPNDIRNTLYKQYIRILNILKPKVSVIENVKALTFKRNKPILTKMLKDLIKSGYTPRLKIMNAKYYNCATARERTIIISTRNDLNIIPSFPMQNKKVLSAREVCQDIKINKIKKLSPQVKKYALFTKPGESLSKYHPKGSFFNQRHADLDKPLPTITKTDTFFVKYKNDYRYLTPDELAACQSFPSWYKWIGSWNDKVSRIGNSVPPLMMKNIAEHIFNTVLN